MTTAIETQASALDRVDRETLRDAATVWAMLNVFDDLPETAESEIELGLARQAFLRHLEVLGIDEAELAAEARVMAGEHLDRRRRSCLTVAFELPQARGPFSA